MILLMMVTLRNIIESFVAMASCMKKSSSCPVTQLFELSVCHHRRSQQLARRAWSVSVVYRLWATALVWTLALCEQALVLSGSGANLEVERIPTARTPSINGESSCQFEWPRENGQDVCK